MIIMYPTYEFAFVNIGEIKHLRILWSISILKLIGLPSSSIGVSLNFAILSEKQNSPVESQKSCI